MTATVTATTTTQTPAAGFGRRGTVMPTIQVSITLMMWRQCMPFRAYHPVHHIHLGPSGAPNALLTVSGRGSSDHHE